MSISKQNKSGKNDKEKGVFKYSSSIHMSDEISSLERRVFNVLLAQAYDNLKKQETHEISIRDLAYLLQFNGTDYTVLKKSLHILNVTSVPLDYLRKDNDDWESSTFLSGVKIIDDTCLYGYSFVMRERLGNINEMFEKFKLSDLLQDTSSKKKKNRNLWEIFKYYFFNKKQ